MKHGGGFWGHDICCKVKIYWFIINQKDQNGFFSACQSLEIKKGLGKYKSAFNSIS